MTAKVAISCYIRSHLSGLAGDWHDLENKDRQSHEKKLKTVTSPPLTIRGGSRSILKRNDEFFAAIPK